MDVPIWQRSIPFLLLYFAPVFIGAYRRMQGKEKSWPVWGLFLVIFLTGWTVIGWLFALRKAFKDVELPWDKVLNPGGSSAQGGWTPPADGGGAPAPRQKCFSCGGNGEIACSVCAGRGSWYDGPKLVTCAPCGASGKIRCMSCGGSGYA